MIRFFEEWIELNSSIYCFENFKESGYPTANDNGKEYSAFTFSKIQCNIDTFFNLLVTFCIIKKDEFLDEIQYDIFGYIKEYYQKNVFLDNNTDLDLESRFNLAFLTDEQKYQLEFLKDKLNNEKGYSLTDKIDTLQIFFFIIILENYLYKDIRKFVEIENSEKYKISSIYKSILKIKEYIEEKKDVVYKLSFEDRKLLVDLVLSEYQSKSSILYYEDNNFDSIQTCYIDRLELHSNSNMTKISVFDKRQNEFDLNIEKKESDTFILTKYNKSGTIINLQHSIESSFILYLNNKRVLNFFNSFFYKNLRCLENLYSKLSYDTAYANKDLILILREECLSLENTILLLKNKLIYGQIEIDNGQRMKEIFLKKNKKLEKIKQFEKDDTNISFYYFMNPKLNILDIDGSKFSKNNIIYFFRDENIIKKEYFLLKSASMFYLMCDYRKDLKKNNTNTVEYQDKLTQLREKYESRCFETFHEGIINCNLSQLSDSSIATIRNIIFIFGENKMIKIRSSYNDIIIPLTINNVNIYCSYTENNQTFINGIMKQYNKKLQKDYEVFLQTIKKAMKLKTKKISFFSKDIVWNNGVFHLENKRYSFQELKDLFQQKIISNIKFGSLIDSLQQSCLFSIDDKTFTKIIYEIEIHRIAPTKKNLQNQLKNIFVELGLSYCNSNEIKEENNENYYEIIKKSIYSKEKKKNEMKECKKNLVQDTLKDYLFKFT